MKLNELLAGAGVDLASGSKLKIEITGVTHDSRQVKPGDLFVALPGNKTDGLNYVSEAVSRGAVAIVAEQPVEGKTPAFQVTSAKKALAVIASNYHGRPSDKLSLLAVTGTNGKTTTSYILEAICSAGGAATGLVGTIAHRYAGKSVEATHTTPEPLELHRLFRQMVDAGIDTVVMEVSSHALEQERVHGLTFRSAAFTNLTRDHLDYHKDMEAYFQAKRKLFVENLSAGGVAIVNGDDTNCSRIYNEVRGMRRMAWKFSREGNGEISAANVELTTHGIKAVLKTPAGDIPIKSQLLGVHNLENIMAAAGMALSAGFSRRDVQDGVERVVRVPGRMDKVESRGVVALVDYAHTDDALRRALESARTLCKGRLIVVFGCGGERDSGKRPLMGEVAARGADLPIVTTDNPRYEDPEDIIADILPGLETGGLRRMSSAKAKSGERGYVVEIDREAAINQAVALARPDDVIVIAGKGHENYQIVQGEKKPFDDLEIARRAIEG